MPRVSFHGFIIIYIPFPVPRRNQTESQKFQVILWNRVRERCNEIDGLHLDYINGINDSEFRILSATPG